MSNYPLTTTKIISRMVENLVIGDVVSGFFAFDAKVVAKEVVYTSGTWTTLEFKSPQGQTFAYNMLRAKFVQTLVKLIVVHPNITYP